MHSWHFFCDTFGCKVNQYETESVREAWTARGGSECSDPSGADIILVNS
ncbi:MAG: tRNA (N6-isopentenyl adenosine(37)-C2)-methylthiotransferase MiaB, partial [Desulfovibrio sp.]